MASGEILAELVLEGDQQFQSSLQNASGGIDEVGTAADGATGSADGFNQSLMDIDGTGVAVGGTLMGLGAAMQGTINDTKDMRAELNQVGTNMGLTSQEANKLAREVSNATFPMQDATATMTALAQAGIENEQVMKDTAAEFDNIADATGYSAEEMTNNLGPALKAMGQDFQDVGEHADTFTYIQQETTMELDQFGQLMERMGPDLRDMGLGFEETASMIAAMEERGITGREAMQRLRQATNSGAETQAELAKELGISQEAIAAQSKKMQEAEGITDTYAQSANETVTTQDRLGQAWEEAKLKLGGMLGPIETLAPALMGLGGTLSTVSAINFSAVIPSLAGVYSALIPLMPVIIPLVAVFGTLAVAWKKDLGGIQGKVSAFASLVTEKLTALVGKFESWASGVQSSLQPVIDLLGGEATKTVQAWAGVISSVLAKINGLWESHGSTVMGVVEPLVSSITTLIEGMMDTLISVISAGLALLRGDWEQSWQIMADLLSRQGERLGEIAGNIVEWIKSPFENLDQWARAAGEGLINAMTDGIKSMASKPVEAVEGVAQNIRDKLPSSDAKEGPLSSLTAAGKALPETLQKGIQMMASKPVQAVKRLAGKISEYLPSSDAEKGDLANLSAAGKALPETVADGIESNDGAAVGAVEGMAQKQQEALEATELQARTQSQAGAAGGRAGGAGGESTTIEVDARMEAGAVQFSGVTWDEALEEADGLMKKRLQEIERSISRKHLRGAGAGAGASPGGA